MTFEKSKLGTLFANVERIEGKVYPDHYAVVNVQGSTVAQIVFTSGGDMNIEVDNFPAVKQYYSSSIPIRTLDDFISDIKRVGIELITFREKSLAAQREMQSKPINSARSANGVVDHPQDTGKDDVFYPEAILAVCESQKATVSFIQRKLRIGYNRATYLIEAMEKEGIVSPANENGGRTVLKQNQSKKLNR